MIMMNNRKAFTMVELLTVVSIIALLLGILLPSISAIRARAKEVAQIAQFNTIETALETFNQVYGDYPPSNLYDNSSPVQQVYMGSQKLAEALLGWDLMGFHLKTAWRSDGCTGNLAFNNSTPGVTDLSYDPFRTGPTTNGQPATLFERKGPYLDTAKANAFKISDLYPSLIGANYNTFVLCDVYRVRKLIDKTTGKVIFAGSPILYYKANTANKTIDSNFAPPPVSPLTFTNRIYDYFDNKWITDLPKLTANGYGSVYHPLGYLDKSGTDYPVFYESKVDYNPNKAPPMAVGPATYGGSGKGYGIRDPKAGSNPTLPYNPVTYILISAGPDGLYGTADDIHNF